MAAKPFGEVYEAWRIEASRFSMESVVVTALEMLGAKRDSRHEEVAHAPWLTMLIVKWVCQESESGDRPISVEELEALRQSLWEMPERIEFGPRDTLPVHLFMRQLIRPQIDFQRVGGSGVLREAALLEAQPANSRLRRLFEKRAGLRVEDYLDLTAALYNWIGQGHSMEVWVDTMSSLYPESIEAFLSNVALDMDQLKSFCRSLPSAERKVLSELFEFPALKRYPFMRMTDGTLRCWHPVVFMRGMEGLVHSILSEEGQEYMQLFSRLFEKHVVEQAASLPGLYCSEADLREWLGPSSEVPDGLLSVDGVNIFFESKAGMYDESVMTMGHSGMFRKRTEPLAKAISQARAASTGLRTVPDVPDSVATASKDFLLVVTNKEVSAGRGDRLASMYPDGALQEEADHEGWLPLERIYFLSIEDFERLVAGCRHGGSPIKEVLGECVRRDNDPDRRVFYFEQRLDDLRFPKRSSELVRCAQQTAMARVKQRAGLEDGSV